jgi:ketosteroid isomerase-like protein
LRLEWRAAPCADSRRDAASSEGEEFHAVGEQVVNTAHLRAKGRASGVELDHPISNVVWFREGKVARVESFLNPEQALDAAAKDLDEAGR